ncbi:MAG: Fe-S protein assembly co-chaperone HscB, partial [Vibrio sp.]
AAEINDAYHVLKSPISRAEYLLALHDVDIRAEQQTMSDPEFLMTQMELREALSELADAQDPEVELFDFSNKVDVMYQQQHQELAQKLEQHQWQDAADDVRKLKFIEKLQKEIELLEDKLLG